MDDMIDNFLHRSWIDTEFKLRPAEGLRLMAVDHYVEKDYPKAIARLNQALGLNDKGIEPLIFELRASCYKELNQEDKYISDIINSINSLWLIDPINYNKISDLHRDVFLYYWEKNDLKNAEIAILKAEEIIELNKTDELTKSGVYVWLARLNMKIGNSKKARIYKENSLFNSRKTVLKEYDQTRDESKPIYTASFLENNKNPLSLLFPNLFDFFKEEQSFSTDSKTQIVDTQRNLELITFYKESPCHKMGLRITADFRIMLFVNDIKDNEKIEAIDIQIMNDLNDPDDYSLLYNDLEMYLLELQNF